MRDSGGVRSFHDLPLWVKALLAPMACLAAAVANEALPAAGASAALLDNVDTVHVMAMRALVWQQAGVPQATIDGLIVDITHGLDSLRANTAAMAAGGAGGDMDPTRLRQIAAQ